MVIGKSYKSRDLSQFDGSQTDKLAFDDKKQSYRFHDSEGPCYDRFETIVDGSGNITQITYYQGVDIEVLELAMAADVAGSLNSKYFTLSSTFDQIKYYVWYNVDGNGVDPAIPGMEGIEVSLVSNDSSSIVAMATRQMVLLKAGYHFDIDRVGGVLTIRNKKEGTVNDTLDVDTGFVFNVIQNGTEEVTAIYKLSYSGCDLTEFYKL